MEHKLGLLQQELSIVDWIVEIQANILDKMLTTGESMAEHAEAGESTTTPERQQGIRDDVPRRRELTYRRPPHNTLASMAETILEPRQPSGFSHMLLQESLKYLALKRSETKLMGDVVAYLTATVCFPCHFTSTFLTPFFCSFSRPALYP
jgi:hypothetical protein